MAVLGVDIPARQTKFPRNGKSVHRHCRQRHVIVPQVERGCAEIPRLAATPTTGEMCRTHARTHDGRRKKRRGQHAH